MHTTLAWTLILIALVFATTIIHGFRLSANKNDFSINQTSDTSWKKAKNADEKANQHCYDYNDKKRGIPQLCWKTEFEYNKGTLEMNIKCTLFGSRYTVFIYADEKLKTCPGKKEAKNNVCDYVIQQPELYADRQFSCLFNYSQSDQYSLQTFILTDSGKPSKPMLSQEGSSLNCYANMSRSSSVLEIIKLESSNNKISIIEMAAKDDGCDLLQISYDLPSPSSGKFVCRHKYSRRSEDSEPLQVEVNLTTADEAPSDDKKLQYIIYGVIAVVVFGVLVCLIIVVCSCWKNRKRAYNPTESSTEDIFAIPTPKEQRNQDEYAVPVPKSQRNATDEYAMVIPKNKRPGYADPAYADPCDLRGVEPDPVYMDIGTALYASISIYDEVAPSGRSDCESVEYANSETINRNRTPSASPRSNPIYASVKRTKGPRPRPRQRLKPTQNDGYNEML